MDLLIYFILTFGIGVYVGRKWREYQALQTMRWLERQIVDTAAAVEKNTIVVNVEKSADSYLVYNKRTGEFLAQGKSHDEIAATLSARYPTTTFVADNIELDNIGYKK